MFKEGDRVRLIDDRGIAWFRKRRGFENGTEHIVSRCWQKIKQGRSLKRLIILEGYDTWIFSTRRFELINSNHFDDGLFEL